MEINGRSVDERANLNENRYGIGLRQFIPIHGQKCTVLADILSLVANSSVFILSA